MDQRTANQPLQPAHDQRAGQSVKHDELEDALERGLRDTFPASDPVAVTEPRRRRYARQDPRKR